MVDIYFQPIKDEGRKGFAVSINGILDKSILLENDELPISQIKINDLSIIHYLSQYTIDELAEVFDEFDWEEKVIWWTEKVRITVDYLYDENIFNINFFLVLNGFSWAKPWTIRDTYNEFTFIFEDFNRKSSELKITSNLNSDDGYPYDGILISFEINRGGLQFKSYFENTLTIIENTLRIANQNLLEKLDNEALITYFHFPPVISTACKQYLIYFTQFIADMGIDVSSEIVEEPNQTLFKVTPKDKGEALSKIRQALDIYLTLPTNHDFESEAERFPDLAVMQLSKKIHDLKGDFKIAEMQMKMQESMIQMKDATIQLKDATIGTLESRVLELSQYQQKPIDEKKELEKEEDLIKGIVSVKKFEAKGVSVNLGELLRRLKRKFS